MERMGGGEREVGGGRVGVAPAARQRVQRTEPQEQNITGEQKERWGMIKDGDKILQEKY